MAIQGLIGTGDLGTNALVGSYSEERPLNWRQGILMRYPNGHAPLTALTSVMKKKMTDDPLFHWWEREVSNVRLELGADIADEAGPSTWTITPHADFGGGYQVKAGDLILVEESGEIVQVSSVTSDTVIVVTRDWGTALGDTPAVDYDGATVNPYLLIIGSAYEEGAGTPESIRYRPSKMYNYTQIFRDSLKATRTAMQTRLRTVDEVRDAKQQALLYHSIRMEYAFIHGVRYEGTGSGGEPIRSTGGVVSVIPAANIIDLAGTALDMETFEAYMLEAFRFGSQEKIGFVGNRALMGFVQMARRNASIEITPVQREFGMDIRRFFTPYGTIVLKMHPLFNQVQSQIITDDTFYGMDAWALIMDMADLVYRPLKNSDTQYLPDRQDNGVDGLTSEYLTECGLEVHNGKHHFLLKGLAAGAADS